MYDLRIVVEEVRGFCDMPMRPGDWCELRGSRLYIPEGRYFCMWALQSVLPLLPVKQRLTVEDNDWIPRTFRVACPDPEGMVILRIDQIDPRGDSAARGATGERVQTADADSEGRSHRPEPRTTVPGPRGGGPPARLLVDRRACTGCRSCELACSFRHEGVFAPSLSRIWVRKDEPLGLDEPVVCRQCGVARCVQVCPSGALSRDPRTGAVLVDAGLCVRCGECVGACPFGAIRIHPDTALPLICDLCEGDPACVRRCVTGALRYGRPGQTHGGPSSPAGERAGSAPTRTGEGEGPEG